MCSNVNATNPVRHQRSWLLPTLSRNLLTLSLFLLVACVDVPKPDQAAQHELSASNWWTINPPPYHFVDPATGGVVSRAGFRLGWGGETGDSVTLSQSSVYAADDDFWDFDMDSPVSVHEVLNIRYEIDRVVSLSGYAVSDFLNLVHLGDWPDDALLAYATQDVRYRSSSGIPDRRVPGLLLNGPAWAHISNQ